MIGRYAVSEINDLWNPDAVYRRWFEVECEHVQTVAGADTAGALRGVGSPSPTQVRYYESQSGHEMIAFLAALDANVKVAATRAERHGKDLDLLLHVDNIRSALHYGLTSSDVQDTALALGMQRSKFVVDQASMELMHALVDLMAETRGTVTIGRTHGQFAATMDASHRWEVLHSMVSRCYTRTSEAMLNLKVGKLSGPVGVLARDDEANTLERLGVYPTDSTQLVPRDRLANWGYQTASLITACEAVATQVWLLAQQGIMEVKVNDAVSSSAMPHKRNPVSAENIRGLARIARPLAQQLELGMVQWGEHDLAHSPVERVAVPDLLHLTVGALRKTARLVSGMTVGIADVGTSYRDSSAVLRSAQAAGMAWADAHRAISEGRLTLPYQGGKIPATTATTEETK